MSGRVNSRADYEEQRRAEESQARRDRYAAAVALNGGRSAPQSEASRATGFTPIEKWREDFPQAGGFEDTRRFRSAPPRISARDAAIAASGQTQPVSFAPAPMVTRDASGIPTQNPADIVAANLAHYQGGMGRAPAGAPRLDARSIAAMSTPPSQSSQPPTMTPSAPIVASPPVAAPPAAAPQAGPATVFQRFDPEAQERTSLYASHPAIFEAGTPENIAYVAYAKEHGERAALDNLDSILSRPMPGTIVTPPPKNRNARISAYV